MSVRRSLAFARTFALTFALALGATLLGCRTRTLAPKIAEGEGFVTVPGGRVWYRVVGHGPGTPLILLHGGPGAPSYYLKPLLRLADDRPVIIYDQLGAGKSSRSSDTTLWRMGRFIDELAMVRRKLGIGDTYLLGHSWGAMLAVDYVLTKPPGVRGLILASPSISIPLWMRDADSLVHTLPDSVQRVIAANERAGTTTSAAYQAAVGVYFSRYLSRRTTPSADGDSTRTNFGDAVYATMWGPSEFAATGSLRNYDRRPDLGRLGVPVLYTAGRYDEARPATVAEFQRLTPDSRLVVFEHSAHLTMQDETERYVAVVREFLRGLDARR